MKFKQYINESQVIHWKKSKFSEYTACDKKGSSNLKLSNSKVKHTDNPNDITCKKCQKEYLGLGKHKPPGW